LKREGGGPTVGPRAGRARVKGQSIGKKYLKAKLQTPQWKKGRVHIGDKTKRPSKFGIEGALSCLTGTGARNFDAGLPQARERVGRLLERKKQRKPAVQIWNRNQHVRLRGNESESHPASLLVRWGIRSLAVAKEGKVEAPLTNLQEGLKIQGRYRCKVRGRGRSPRERD